MPPVPLRPAVLQSCCSNLADCNPPPPTPPPRRPEFLYLWKINKLDWVVWNVTCLVVLFAGVEIGIGVGVGLSLLLVIYKSAFPRISQLGRLPGTTVYR